MHVRFQVFVGARRVALLDFPQVRVSDGEWHHILVELKSGKDGKDIKYMAMISLDYGMFQVCTECVVRQLSTSSVTQPHG